MEIPLGSRVVRGPGWKWGDQDHGEGHLGTAVGTKEGSSRYVYVQWDMGISADYRAGVNDVYDLLIYDVAPAGQDSIPFQSSITLQ